MKVIDNKNKKEKFPMRIQCEYCESTLEIEEEDVERGYAGQACVICPVCKEKTYIYDDDLDVTVTADNVLFPNDFYDFHFGKDVEPEKIQKDIKDVIKWFRKNPEAFCCTTGHGNFGLLVQNYSGDKVYHVVVVKGYWDTEIPYEKADYDAQDSINWEWRNTGIDKWKAVRKGETEVQIQPSAT